MSENNSAPQKKKIFSIAAILLLLSLVSVQAWYMLDLQEELEQLHEQQSAMESQLQARGQAALPPPTAAPEAETDESEMAENLATPEPPQSTSQEEQKAQTSRSQEQEQSQNRQIPPDDTATFDYDDLFNRPFYTPDWNPYAEIERMQREMDRMFDRHFNQLQNDPYFQRPFRQNKPTPEIDVKENEHQYMVFVNLPGSDENDISVTLDGQRLTIKGKQDYKKQDRDPMGNIIFQERRSGSFQRSITLRDPVYQNEMKTRLEDGVLTILIPKVDNGQWRY